MKVQERRLQLAMWSGERMNRVGKKVKNTEVSCKRPRVPKTETLKDTWLK